MKYSKIILLLSMAISFFLFCNSSFSMGKYPSVEVQKDRELQGVFTVIFFGGTYQNDPKTAVIFDIEGDEYTFKPYASKYNYQMNEGIPAELALKESEWFIGRHTDYFTSSFKRVLDNKGSIIGYELKPLFHTRRFGYHDILNVSYWYKGDEVLVSVDVKRKVRKRSFRRNFGIE
jgi:hypothetical protein